MNISKQTKISFRFAVIFVVPPQNRPWQNLGERRTKGLRWGWRWCWGRRRGWWCWWRRTGSSDPHTFVSHASDCSWDCSFFATFLCCRMTLEITTAVTLDQKEKISMDRWRPNPSFFEEGNLVYWCSCIWAGGRLSGGGCRPGGHGYRVLFPVQGDQNSERTIKTLK